MIVGFPPPPNGLTTAEFRCPGESYSISRSVHLARLEASYPKCRHCAYRPGTVGEADDLTESREPTGSTNDGSTSLFTTEGVRGIYLNELNRQVSAELAGAYASCLWEEIPVSEMARILPGSATDAVDQATDSSGESVRLLPYQSAGPTVVIAHDERACTPDLVMGVAPALKRMGFQVVDVGLTTRPCFWFAVEHLQAVGGVFLTGSGCGPAWSGLEFVRAGAIPCSGGGTLDRIQERFRTGFVRVSRRAGSLRTFRVAVPYEAGLWKHFHALRPLRIAFGSPGRLVRDRFTHVFHKLACRLLPVDIAVRERSGPDHDGPTFERIASAVREQQAHLGLFVDDDGQRTVFLDETGRAISSPQIAGLLASLMRAEFPGRTMVAARSALPSGSQVADSALQQSAFVECEPSLEGCAVAMRLNQAVFGAGNDGHYWFDEGFPTCDAIVTVARLLQVLSRSDATFSEVASRWGSLSSPVV